MYISGDIIRLKATKFRRSGENMQVQPTNISTNMYNFRKYEDVTDKSSTRHVIEFLIT